MVGCADGSLYRFSNGAVIQVVQAHAINEPVLCISFNATDGVLVTGGKDCLIKSWDSTLTEVGASLDMSEDLDGDGKADCGSLSPSVTSLQTFKGKILIGTKGSDIFEASVPLNIQDSSPSTESLGATEAASCTDWACIRSRSSLQRAEMTKPCVFGASVATSRLM